MKRLLALLLCVFMCVSLLPSATFAEGSIELTDEDGSEEQGIIMQTEEAADVNGSGVIVSAADGDAGTIRKAAAEGGRREAAGNTSDSVNRRASDKSSSPEQEKKGASRAARAGDDTRITDDEGNYLFSDFAELQNLTDYDYEAGSEAYYAGNQELIVTDDITIPKNLKVYVYEYAMTIPSGKTVTVSADADLIADILYVDGTIVNDGTLYGRLSWEDGEVSITAYLEVNGTIENYGWLGYPCSLVGLDNIKNKGNGYVSIRYPIGSDADLAEMTGIAAADNDYSHGYDGYVIRNMTITGTYDLPESVWLYIYNSEVTIASNAQLRVGFNEYADYSSICLDQNGCLRVEGTLINDSDIDIYKTAALICEEGQGIYTGSGWLGVQDSGKDVFSVNVLGLNQDLFDIEYNAGMSFFGLVLKYYLDKTDLPLTIGSTDTLNMIKTATGNAVTPAWRSSNDEIAAVNSNGVVTAKKVGFATITATIDDDGDTIELFCRVKVLFKDVTDSSQFYYSAIYAMVDKGVIGGYDDGTYRPMNNCNRAAVVTFLWRLAGKPTPAAMATFRDMTGNSDFDNAISWAAEQGITSGWADNTFRPWNTCNRAAIVTFLWRFAGEPEPEAMATFKDMTDNSDFNNAISWAAENGITTGWADNTFRPWNTCNRLAVASFLYRYDNLEGLKTFINLYSFTDEVPGMVERYMELHPGFADRYEVRTTVLKTDEGYTNMLNDALAKGGAKAPDIYCAESAFVIKYTQGDMAAYAAPYEDLGLDVNNGISAAGIAQYSVDIGTRPSDGKVVGLGYQATGGAFIYRRSIAEDVWGSDDPAVVEEKIGAGTQSWDKFWNAAEELKAKGYAIVSGDGDIWHAIENSSDTPWVVNGRLNIDPKREAFLDMSMRLKENGYHNETQDWTPEWEADMAGRGEKEVFGFYGPAWLINYVMVGCCGDTYGDWAVCASNVGFLWGGTWLMANRKDVGTEKGEAIAELLEWITLDCSENGLQYGWANGTWSGEQGTKDTVASGVVMGMANGELDFLSGQDMFEVFMTANEAASGRVLTQYDEDIDSYWREAVRMYANGELTRDEAIGYFKHEVAENLNIAVD